VNPSIACGATGACSIVDAQAGAAFSLGVDSAGDGSGGSSNRIQGSFNESITFTFSHPVYLTQVVFTARAPSGGPTGYVTNASIAETVLNGTAPVTLNIHSNNHGSVFRIGSVTPSSTFGIDSLSFVLTPEPETIALTGIGLIGAGLLGRRRARLQHPPPGEPSERAIARPALQ
jgi:hypothetical protein